MIQTNMWVLYDSVSQICEGKKDLDEHFFSPFRFHALYSRGGQKRWSPT